MKVPVLSSLILSLWLTSPLSAIERPKSLDQDDPNERPATSEPEQVQNPGAGQDKEGELAPEAEVERRQDEGALPGEPQEPAEDVAWLGVLSEPIDETLSLHLDVASGVVLSFVAQDSPAADAGLQRHDVITKVDGRAIASQDDLREEVQLHKAGDEVSLTVINRGQKAERRVKLGERPEAIPAVPPVAENRGGAGGIDFDGLRRQFPGLADRMNEFEKLIPGGGGDLQKQLDAQMERLEKQLRELEKQGGGRLKMDFDLLDNFDDLPKPGAGKGAFNLNFKSSSTLKFVDDAGSVEMKTKDGAKEVTVRDKDGKIIFEGPWDSPQDKAGAPAEIRERIEKFSDGHHFQFRLENLPKLEMELPDREAPKLE